MSPDKRKILGAQRMQEILGEKAPQIIENMRAISPDFADSLLEFAYGGLYARPLLSDKMKELAAVSNLLGQGITGGPLDSHLRGMLNVGWSAEEVKELLLFLVAYQGFPRSVGALYQLSKILD